MTIVAKPRPLIAKELGGLSVFFPEEKVVRALLGAERAPPTITLALLAIVPKTHDTFLQPPLFIADAAMTTVVFHQRSPQPSSQPGFLDKQPETTLL
jgi:hypothetical protein